MTDLAERVADLEEQVAYWKNEAMQRATAEQEDRIRRAFGLTGAQAWLVATLYAARGAVVRRDSLEEHRPGSKAWEDREPGSNVLDVMVSRVRSKVSRDFVETVYAVGFRLPEKSVARIDGFLGEKK